MVMKSHLGYRCVASSLKRSSRKCKFSPLLWGQENLPGKTLNSPQVLLEREHLTVFWLGFCFCFFLCRPCYSSLEGQGKGTLLLLRELVSMLWHPAPQCLRTLRKKKIVVTALIFLPGWQKWSDFMQFSLVKLAKI